MSWRRGTQARLSCLSGQQRPLQPYLSRLRWWACPAQCLLNLPCFCPRWSHSWQQSPSCWWHLSTVPAPFEGHPRMPVLPGGTPSGASRLVPSQSPAPASLVSSTLLMSVVPIPFITTLLLMARRSQYSLSPPSSGLFCTLLPLPASLICGPMRSHPFSPIPRLLTPSSMDLLCLLRPLSFVSQLHSSYVSSSPSKLTLSRSFLQSRIPSGGCTGKACQSAAPTMLHRVPPMSGTALVLFFSSLLPKLMVRTHCRCYTLERLGLSMVLAPKAAWRVRAFPI